jgi:DNA-binding SARP family transcriptional activator
VRAACARLALDEFDEEAQFALVRQLAASGKRRAAKIAAERYLERLRTDLDEEPTPEFGRFAMSLGLTSVSTSD